MANYMIVRQRVTDLTRFQTLFDRLKPNREAAGITDLGQFCAVDEMTWSSSSWKSKIFPVQKNTGILTFWLRVAPKPA